MTAHLEPRGHRCGYCLEHHAACASLRLFSGRSCCPECTHRTDPMNVNPDREDPPR